MFRRRSKPTVPASPAVPTSSPANVAPTWIADGDWKEWEAPAKLIRGESRQMAQLLLLTGPPRELGYVIPVAVHLVREPHNPVDPNALRAEVQGLMVGYVAREVAAMLSPILDAGGFTQYVVPGVVRGGYTSGHGIGVHIWFWRRLVAQPAIEVEIPDEMLASWPPRDGEGGW